MKFTETEQHEALARFDGRSAHDTPELDCCECAGVVLAAIRLLENLDENGRGHGNPEADALRAAIAKAEGEYK